MVTEFNEVRGARAKHLLRVPSANLRQQWQGLESSSRAEPDQSEADQGQRHCKAAHDPQAMKPRRKPCSQWCSNNCADPEYQRPTDTVMKRAREDMHACSRSRGDDQDEVRGSRSGMNRKAQQMNQCRHMHDATADPQQGRDEPDEQAGGNTNPCRTTAMHQIPRSGAMLSDLNTGSGSGAIVFRTLSQVTCHDQHHHAETHVKQPPRNSTGSEGSQYGPGDCREREDGSRAVVDTPLPCIADRSRECVQAHYRKRDARNDWGLFAWVGDQQQRDEQESAARSDQRTQKAENQPDG